jgi:acetyl-CoA carboxylase alpha subunit
LFWWCDKISPLEGCFSVICRQKSKTMDATQATQIRTLLLEAADVIDRVNAIVSAIGSDDLALLAKPLDEISSALHFELLQKLYLRYPGLAQEGEDWDGAA